MLNKSSLHDFDLGTKSKEMHELRRMVWKKLEA